MLSKEEIEKIKELNKLEKQYEKLYEEVESIVENNFGDFEEGDRMGNIVKKTEIPSAAQKNKDGTYVIYHQIGEDWGNGTIYFPLENDEYLEIYYST